MAPEASPGSRTIMTAIRARDLGDVCSAFAAGLGVGATNRGEGTGDERHHLAYGDAGSHNAGRVRATEQVCDIAGEPRRGVRGDALSAAWLSRLGPTAWTAGRRTSLTRCHSRWPDGIA